MKRSVLVPLLLGAAVYAAAYTITVYPDGTDSIGIPDTAYRATCFLRMEPAPGYTFACDVAHRIDDSPATVDCATHVRVGVVNSAEGAFTTTSLWAPLPESADRGYGGMWRHSTTGWCHLLRRTDTGEILWPGCHVEHVQPLSLGNMGRVDPECFYPGYIGDMPVEYLYLEER